MIDQSMIWIINLGAIVSLLLVLAVIAYSTTCGILKLVEYSVRRDNE